MSRNKPIEDISIINKLVAKEMNPGGDYYINEDIITKVNRFYWNEIKSLIQKGDTLNVRVRGFGTITTSKRKLSKAISKVIDHIKYLKFSYSRYKKESTLKLIDDYYEDLRGMLKRRNELASIYFKKDQEIKLKKLKKSNGEK